jgi:hypothetical protein
MPSMLASRVPSSARVEPICATTPLRGVEHCKDGVDVGDVRTRGILALAVEDQGVAVVAELDVWGVDRLRGAFDAGRPVIS